MTKYRRKILYVLVYLTALFANTVAVSAGNNECLSHDQILAAPQDALSGEIPCDLIGGAYFLGLDISIGDSFQRPTEGLSKDFLYYPHFRSYLNLRRRGGKKKLKADEIGFLLTGVALLPTPGLGGNAIATRGNYYAAFALGEFLSSQSEELNESRAAIRSTIFGLVPGELVQNLSELSCFISYDIPTLDLAVVVESRNYQNCIGAN